MLQQTLSLQDSAFPRGELGHSFIVKMPKLCKLCGIISEQYNPFKSISREAVVRNL